MLLCQYVAQKGRGEAVNFCSGWLADYSESKLQKVDYLAIRKQVRAL